MSEELYHDGYTAFLEEVWGEGFLSPGGPEEVARILDGLDLNDARVLDIGCGIGAITLALARDYGAAHVTGIDVEKSVCQIARNRASNTGFADRITIQQVEPGPLDFADHSFDVVFSKDSIIHIPDKNALAEDVFRILKPGGWFAASDWLISHDDSPSPEMARYIELEDNGLAMASPARYESALIDAGFESVSLTSRNAWYAEVSRRELDFLSGDARIELERNHDLEIVNSMVEIWEAMVPVLESGEHCPTHLRARRPD